MVRHKEMRETTILTSAALEGVSLSVERSSLYARSLAISLRWTEGSHQNGSAFLECPYWTAQSPPRRRYRHRPCCPTSLVYPYCGATQLNDWLLTKDSLEIAYLVNKFQIIWRQRPLTSSEHSDVRDIRRRALRAGDEFSALQEAGCELLLGNHAAFKEIFHNLTDDHQALFKTWPIRKLAPDTAMLPGLEGATPGTQTQWDQHK